MPRKRTHAKGFPRDPEDCYASRHLDGPDYLVYDTMLACAISGRTLREGKAGKGPLLFTASIKPWLCNAVAKTKNPVYATVHRLVELGWIGLVEEGKPKRDGTTSPDTYRIFTHKEFVHMHPGTCPDNEYAPNFETAQEHGVLYGQKLQKGMMPFQFFIKSIDLNSGWMKQLRILTACSSDEEFIDVLRRWYDFDQASVEITGTREQVPDQSPSAGTGPLPVKSTHRYPSKDRTGTRESDHPVPVDGITRSPSTGTELSNASWKATGQGNYDDNDSYDDETVIAATRPRPWLSLSWSLSAQAISNNDQRELRRVLRFRPPKKGCVESDDVVGIENLIETCNEDFVRLAFCEFACDESCPVNAETLYPVSVFLKHFDSYYATAQLSIKEWKEWKRASFALGIAMKVKHNTSDEELDGSGA